MSGTIGSPYNTKSNGGGGHRYRNSRGEFSTIDASTEYGLMEKLNSKKAKWNEVIDKKINLELQFQHQKEQLLHKSKKREAKRRKIAQEIIV